MGLRGRKAAFRGTTPVRRRLTAVALGRYSRCNPVHTLAL